MESKFKVVLITATLFLVMRGGVEMASAHPPLPRMARTQQNKAAPAESDAKTSSGTDCSLLTPMMLGKVLGDSFRATSPEKALPMYGGAPGWSCTYHGMSPGGVRVDFAVYSEASAAKAKQDFDKYSVAADNSRGKPSVGDSAYWVNISKTTLAIYVLKGKVHFSITMRPANEKQMQDLANAVAAQI